MTQTHESPSENPDRDPFKDLRDSLEVMGKKQLTKARADAVKGRANVILTHPLAQDATPKSVPMAALSSRPPKELTVPEMSVHIKAEVLDMGQFTSNEDATIIVTSINSDTPEQEPKELGSFDNPLAGGEYSLRDMQAVVEDIVAMRTMQEQLTSDVQSSVSQAPQS